MPSTQKKKRPIRFSDLMAIQRINGPAVSPDQTRVAFDTASCDARENKVSKTIRILDLKTQGVTELTPGPGDHHSPAWSPDGAMLAFVSNRDKEKGAQLWIMPTSGGEATCVTSGWGGVSAPLWSPDSTRIAFARQVVVSPDYDAAKDKNADPAKAPGNGKIYNLANEKSSARISNDLLFRHWDHWRDKSRSHLFLVDVKTGKMTDLIDADADVPPISLGSARDFDFSPDGKEIAFVMNPDQVVARSTNNSIFVLPIKGIKAAGPMRCISNTDACDVHPRYTPDGQSIVYLGMATPGFEADKTRIKVYNRGTGATAVRLDRFDRSPHEFVFAGDDPNFLFFLAQDRGRVSLYRLNLSDGSVRQMTLGTTNSMLRAIPGSADLLVARQSATAPNDFYRLTCGEGIQPLMSTGPVPGDTPVDAGCKAARLTHFGNVLSSVEMNPAEEFWYPAEDKVLVHGFLIKPPSWRKNRKYPLILLIHGGPQGAFMDDFHYRWNAQMFAREGAVVAFLNPRGSTGYGQKFTDQISGDWGGECYRDILLGLDYILKTRPYIDKNRIGAAGASFGGFMVNWIAGHTDRFAALVCHDGIFCAETMAYTTDELWFDEHEHGGLPHVNREDYIRFSPHRFAGNFKTPTLVIHGGNDFRCPISEGIGMFTALQVMEVPSRFLHFPDEGHWVLQPANSEVWYHEVIGWLMQYLDK